MRIIKRKNVATPFYLNLQSGKNPKSLDYLKKRRKMVMPTKPPEPAPAPKVPKLKLDWMPYPG